MAPVPVSLFPAAESIIRAGGTPVTAIYGPVLGGIIVNPATAADQGVRTAENLYVDLVNPAALAETATTIELQPGQQFFIPSGGITGNLSVNAASSGHRFSAVVFQVPVPFPPTPAPGPFPPSGPTSLQKTIPAYLYDEYNDDSDLRAFWAAYNTLVQQYVAWFVQIGLPVYTGPLIVGALLDWIAEGLYGMGRPALPSGRNQNLGPFNTFTFNGLVFNGRKVIGPSNYYATTDDTFKRVLTWHLYKGDGKYFDVRWLKRRIMRFLVGLNGTAPNIDQTYQISITFGLGNQVNIRILNGERIVTSGSFFNRNAFNTTGFNVFRSRFVQFAPLQEAAILQSAIEAGVLELPFQFQYIVTVV